MEKVLNQAEILAESILESEVFIKMRLAEQAAMKDETATRLIGEYSAQRSEIEQILAGNDLDHDKLTEAGQKLEEIEHEIDANELIQNMQKANAEFTDMMKQVNSIIKFVVTGEKDEEQGCSGSCDSCGGSCHCH